MLRDPKYILSVTYLEGSALLEHDLKRARAETAESIFILTNKFSLHPDQTDALSILQNLSIKRYLTSLIYNPPKHTFYADSEPIKYNQLYCMQIIRQENIKHLGNMYTELGHKDIIICINDIKMGVLAKSLIYPGANTLIMNLVCSFAEEGGDDDVEEKEEKIAEDSSNPNNTGSSAWLK